MVRKVFVLVICFPEYRQEDTLHPIPALSIPCSDMQRTPFRRENERTQIRIQWKGRTFASAAICLRQMGLLTNKALVAAFGSPCA